MALFVLTDQPEFLLTAFKKAVDNNEVRTWSYDQDGDLTHTAERWVQKAWFRPKIRRELLYLPILSPTNSRMSTLVYAVYHGRLIESLLVHCDGLFTEARASSAPTADDVV